jgi:hypothetical protein
MIRRFLLVSTLAATLTAFTAVGPSQAAPPTASITAPLSGTCSFLDTTTNQVVNGTLSGTLSLTQFTASGGQLFATGTINATCTAVNSLGQTVTKTVSGTATFPAVGGQGSCRILHLTLGPIHLDLLGLVIDTNQIVLDITAQSGPGNLLGNLLCAVANALNGGAGAQQLANLLNRILAILG